MDLGSVFGISIVQIIVGFGRAAGLMAAAPVFGSNSVLPQVKIVIAFGLALIVAPFIKTNINFDGVSFLMAFFTLLEELLIGLIIGFIANLTVYAVQLAGYFIDVSIGFGIVNIIDPNSGSEMPILGQFNIILALLVFLAINGHHTLITAFVQSYEYIKPGALVLRKEAVGVMVQAFSSMFFLGFKIAIPVLGAIFLADVALGIIAKLIPQINVFIVGFPIKIVLGMIMLIFFIPIYVLLIEATFSGSGDTFRYLHVMLRHLH